MKRGTIAIAVICGGVAAVSFLLTHALGPKTLGAEGEPRSALLNWLEVSAAQGLAIRSDDPGFESESAELMAQLRRERHALASLLETEGASDQKVLKQVDRLSAIETQLERRITEYVLRIRHHLTPQQQKKLMGLCAQGIRGDNRCRWCEDSANCRCKPAH